MIIDENGLEFINTKYGLLKHCDTISTNIIGDKIKTILVELHCDDNNIECLYIPFLDDTKNHDNIFGYYVSIYSSEYIVKPKIPLSYDEIMELQDLVNNNWDKLMEIFKDECDNCYSKDCIHKNRVLPKCPPNYMYLK